MKFKSNNCIAVEVPNLTKAQAFYEGVLGFRLEKRAKDHLLFDTGHFKLYVNKGRKARAPIPSFDVASVAKARQTLIENGCTIVTSRRKSLYFKDPFGIVFDVIED